MKILRGGSQISEKEKGGEKVCRTRIFYILTMYLKNQVWGSLKQWKTRQFLFSSVLRLN